MTDKLPNRLQAYCSEFLTHVDQKMVYWPGKSNGIADTLTKGLETFQKGGDERIKNMEQVVVKQQNLMEQLHLFADGLPVQGHHSISDMLTEADVTVPHPEKLVEAIRTKGNMKEITLGKFVEASMRIPYCGKLDVPETDELQLWLIQQCHYTAYVEHPGRVKMFDLLDQHYYWGEMV